MMADEQAEPLTGAELSEILGRLDQSRQFLTSGINDDVTSGFKLASAMSDLARLLATLEAVRPVVVAVAELGETRNDLCYCWHHDETRDVAGQTEEWIDMGMPHKPTCVYIQARALKERLGW